MFGELPHLPVDTVDGQSYTKYTEELKARLTQTTHNHTLIQKAINKNWNLTQFLTDAAQIEDTSL